MRIQNFVFPYIYIYFFTYAEKKATRIINYKK